MIFDFFWSFFSLFSRGDLFKWPFLGHITKGWPPSGNRAASAGNASLPHNERASPWTGRIPITADLIILDKMALRSNGRLTAASKSAVEAFEHLNHHVLWIFLKFFFHRSCLYICVYMCLGGVSGPTIPMLLQPHITHKCNTQRPQVSEMWKQELVPHRN